MRYEKVELISPESSKAKAPPPMETPPPPSMETSPSLPTKTSPPPKLSPMSQATLKAVKERNKKRSRKRTPGAVELHYDNTYARYQWLLSGWIAEERFVPTGRGGIGRIYKSYYDPTGMRYCTKRDVLYANAWEKTKNIIFID
ncbi:hypothetical protein F3Y22_tig00117027pilonHSYRG00029 [Hibiscus syriacus]|uniref:MBD domain-containing protein n=1 Tax=Hibiscus syriacus TaxID=106335 RepID=A0A6A2X0I4_HIBSY|nr:uncharacterized protein LOC120196149 [Hibiscus syriacus]KAE8655426.1 hypothetical protein F3Y22_tig00117027pilonHSYRG00029 [Hibiscus syriacus]